MAKELASAADNQLLTLHLRGMIPYSRIEHAAEGVFHFLRLHQLHSGDLDSHARYYLATWRGWIRTELKKGRVDSALEIFSLVTTTTTEHQPASPQKLFEIMNASLENLPPLAAIVKMERSLARIERARVSASKVPTEWSNGLKRASAALLLCRAHAVEDQHEGVTLAMRALKLDPYLSDRIPAYLVKAGEALGASSVAAGKYKDAIE